MWSSACLQACFCKLSWQFQNVDPVNYPSTPFQTISDAWQWSLHGPLCIRAHTIPFAEFFRKQSSLAPQATETNNLPQTHHHVSIELHKKNMQTVFSHPPPWKYLPHFKASTGELGQKKQKAYGDKAHIQSSSPVIKPGTSVVFSGCLCAQVICPRPAVPFSLFPFTLPLLLLPMAVQRVFHLMVHQKSRFVVYSSEGGSRRELVRW